MAFCRPILWGRRRRSCLLTNIFGWKRLIQIQTIQCELWRLKNKRQNPWSMIIAPFNRVSITPVNTFWQNFPDDVELEEEEEFRGRTDSTTSGQSTSSVSELIPPPPDGGWGWAVVFAAFIINVVVDGICYAYGEKVTRNSSHVVKHFVVFSACGLMNRVYSTVRPRQLEMFHAKF